MALGEDELFGVLESVHDEESFVQFLLALRDDREMSISCEQAAPSSPYGPDARDWENSTIERFFDAAVRWARDSAHVRGSNSKPENPWRRCAEILHAAKGYE